ncbi:glycosyltransferase family 25 protein [Ramlibacter ginsenosidimutans]|uniref:Glycosyltransferase family 25 protein n=1 Tax=Ramlibacter ginsenosidimutans TaxID=502333 RepID=A0A934TQ73_9BURK|nr:glycosyltransferase family 25 protein [Ramlibacter ginsenosidimutans]MBK6005170.1 glycosyltransferase family 25 protein [Ramlibacter ginsenosidimutans]
MRSAFWNLFERIYVINLESRPDRRKEIDEQLRRVGLGLYQPPVELFRAVRPDGAGAFETIGARGCFLSHLGVIQDAIQNRLESFLILEDDVDFSDDFEQRSNALAEALRSVPWSLFYGGYRLDRKVVGSGCLRLNPDQGVETSHFVGLKGSKVARALLVYMQAQLGRPAGDPLGGPMHVDGTYSWFRRDNPELVTLLSVPEISHQRSSHSDIYERSGLDGFLHTTRLFRAARKLRNRLA